MMFSFFFGISQIHPPDLPGAFLPKRQLVGTGMTTTASTTSLTGLSSSSTSSTTTTTTTTSIATSTEPSPSSVFVSGTGGSTLTLPTFSRAISSSSSHASSTTASSTSKTTSSAVVHTETGTSSDIVLVGSSTINRSTLSHTTTITTPLVAHTTVPSTFTSVWTTDGSVHRSLVPTHHVVASTTGFATATIAPSLQDAGSSSNSLSDASKKIIGGVVGGVGAVIILGGLAIVFWRLWGKKKRQRLPQDDYMEDPHDSNTRQEKRSSFQDLAGYRNPNSQVNTAKNF